MISRFQRLWRSNRIIACWLIALILAAFFFLEPIKTEKTRLAMILFAGALWVCTVAVLWRWKWPAVLLLVATLAGGVFVLMPGRPADGSVLRTAYIRDLKSYTGTVYIWGGENHLGVDCSGLVRCGMMDADLYEGIRTRNARLVRNAMVIWWKDCSADDLGNGYGGRTVPVTTARGLKRVDYRLLKPGDLDVTDGGLHVLAYLGDKAWIEATPNPMRVVIESTPNTHDPYFLMPAKIVRWRELAD